MDCVKDHPYKAVAGHVCNFFNDNVLPCFRQNFKRRQSSDSEATPSPKTKKESDF